MYHVVFLVTKGSGMSQDEFIRYWIDEHTPLTSKLPGLRSYRCYPMIAPMDGPRPPFDAVATLAFDDEASCKLALASEEFKIAVADGPNFQTVEATYGYYAKEYVIV